MLTWGKALPIERAIDSYLLHLRLEGRSTSTLENYSRVLNRLALRFHRKAVQGLTADGLHTYLAELSEGVSKSSMVTYTTICKSFFTWMIKNAYIKKDPLSSVTVHVEPWDPVEPLRDDEVKRLIHATRTPMERLLVLLLLDTGMRIGELTAIELDDIDQGVIKIRGKGGKRRHMALNLGPKLALERYLVSALRSDGSLWPEGFNRGKASYMLDGVARRAGITRVFPHRLRHTWATRFLRESGGDALALKALLGHSSLIMTQRYVAALEEERALEVHRQHPVAC